MDSMEKKRQVAIQFLVNIGLLIPANNVQLYHGRVKPEDEIGEWAVDPNFDNSGNKTGNLNVNSISTLSTGEYELAKEFADTRYREKRGRGTAEVHRIVTKKGDLIFNRMLDFSSLSVEVRKTAMQALRVLTGTRLSKFAPVDFEYRDIAELVNNELKYYIVFKGAKYFTNKDIDVITAKLRKTNPRVDRELVSHIASAQNMRNLFIENPEEALKRFTFAKTEYERTTYQDPKTYESYPLNVSYMASLLSDIKIVGIKSLADSNTVGHRIKAYYMFDLHRIQTEKQQGDRVRQIMDDYNDISLLLGNFDLKENDVLPPLKTSTAPEIMDSLNNSPKFGHLFKADSKVWEHFSVGEHTETVLRVFEDNFSEELPQELLPFMKLAIICHDIGKGMPEREGESVTQRNLNYSHMFLDHFKLPRKIEMLIRFIIGESQKYTTRYYVKKDLNADNELYVQCMKVIMLTFGVNPTDEQAKGLMNMCKILQNCDSAAYTRYAVTRDKNTGMYYKNANDSFTENFEKPTDIGKKRLRMKDPKNM